MNKVLEASHSTALAGETGTVLDVVIAAVILSLIVFATLKLRARNR